MVAWAATAAALAWLVFLVWYTLRAKWWKTPYGRNVFEVGAVLFVITLRIAIVSHWPHLRQNPWVGTVVYWLAAAAAVRRIVLLERAQRSEVVD